jgi:hypothetical protein
MRSKHKYLFLLLTVFWISAIAQNLTKIKATQKDTSIFATYTWEMHDKYHGAQIDLILYKNKTFKYNSYFPHGRYDSSEGNFRISKGKLILNSYLQKDSIPVEIKYVDTPLTTLTTSRLYYPKNNKGEMIGMAYYNLNYDTSFEKTYVPLISRDSLVPKSITALKVSFNYNSFSTPWIPIQATDKNIEVIIKTDHNFDYYKELVFKNKKYTIKGKKLIELKK